MVERCVRDAEAACSNHVASIYLRPDGQAAKTTPSHGVNPGSIPGQVIRKQADNCLFQTVDKMVPGAMHPEPF